MSNNPVVYLAARGFVNDLKEELLFNGISIRDMRGRLILAQGCFAAAWAQNIWLNPIFLPIQSVSGAARALKSMQRNWKLHAIDHFRRAALIEQQLPPVNVKAMRFGEDVPRSPLGSWTLWERNVLLASPRCSSPFADGEVSFAEDKVNPPSRAYLKLWEALTLVGRRPLPGELCVDLGASPGGWTWAIAHLGASILSIDKAPLASKVYAMPHVDFCMGSGFSLDTKNVGKIDWLFSDMACYPERLYAAVKKWLDMEFAQNYICTVKLQGQTDHSMINAFRALPGSKLMHLSCNKHELTWINLSAWRETRAPDIGVCAAHGESC